LYAGATAAVGAFSTSPPFDALLLLLSTLSRLWRCSAIFLRPLFRRVTRLVGASWLATAVVVAAAAHVVVIVIVVAAAVTPSLVVVVIVAVVRLIAA